ncbi:apoptosis inhibitory protein 5-domain-containing protein [Chytriomyces sp. MP71]|nr:apoptosis inhibitory protein 5-domain-containing protein [Chytriomyces sp. MP71]
MSVDSRAAPRVRVLAANALPKYVRFFKQRAYDALDRHLDLCEDDDNATRAAAIQSLPGFAAFVPELAPKVVDVLCQLMQTDSDQESAIVASSLNACLDMDAPHTIAAICSQLCTNAIPAIRPKCIAFLRAHYTWSISRSTLLEYLAGLNAFFGAASDFLMANPTGPAWISQSDVDALIQISFSFLDSPTHREGSTPKGSAAPQSTRDQRITQLLLDLACTSIEAAGLYDPTSSNSIKRLQRAQHLSAPLAKHADRLPFVAFLFRRVLTPRAFRKFGSQKRRLLALRIAADSIRGWTAVLTEGKQSVDAMVVVGLEDLIKRHIPSQEDQDLSTLMYAKLECIFYLLFQTEQRYPRALGSLGAEKETELVSHLRSIYAVVSTALGRIPQGTTFAEVQARKGVENVVSLVKELLKTPGHRLEAGKFLSGFALSWRWKPEERLGVLAVAADGMLLDGGVHVVERVTVSPARKGPTMSRDATVIVHASPKTASAIVRKPMPAPSSPRSSKKHIVEVGRTTGNARSKVVPIVWEPLSQNAPGAKSKQIVWTAVTNGSVGKTSPEVLTAQKAAKPKPTPIVWTPHDDGIKDNAGIITVESDPVVWTTRQEMQSSRRVGSTQLATQRAHPPTKLTPVDVGGVVCKVPIAQRLGLKSIQDRLGMNGPKKRKASVVVVEDKNARATKRHFVEGGAPLDVGGGVQIPGSQRPIPVPDQPMVGELFPQQYIFTGNWNQLAEPHHGNQVHADFQYQEVRYPQSHYHPSLLMQEYVPLHTTHILTHQREQQDQYNQLMAVDTSVETGQHQPLQPQQSVFQPTYQQHGLPCPLEPKIIRPGSGGLTGTARSQKRVWEEGVVGRAVAAARTDHRQQQQMVHESAPFNESSISATAERADLRPMGLYERALVAAQVQLQLGAFGVPALKETRDGERIQRGIVGRSQTKGI